MTPEEVAAEAATVEPVEEEELTDEDLLAKYRDQ